MGTTNSLLASDTYGVKVIATALFVFFLVDFLGRKLALFVPGMGMGILFIIIGALLKVFAADPPHRRAKPLPRCSPSTCASTPSSSGRSTLAVRPSSRMSSRLLVLCSLLTQAYPRDEGTQLEEMDDIFGAVQEDKRRADTAERERGTRRRLSSMTCS